LRLLCVTLRNNFKNMKNTFLSLILIIVAAIAVMAFTIPTGKTNNPPQDKPAAQFPADIQKIFETSCFDCHTDLSSNPKSKAKLNFTTWDSLSAAKKVGKIQDISDVVSKGDMPPTKYLEKFPEKALSKEQNDLVIKWAVQESDKLMGQ
jgi:hypothetical protein